MADDARLVTIIEVKLDQIDARLSKFNRALYGSASKAQKDLDTMDARFKRVFADQNPSQRLGAFGKELNGIGPAGIVAAGGIVALVAAFNQARVASAFADGIADTAKRLHVTTDALQEYRYAIRLAGGEEKGADEALESFNVTLGKAQAGLPKALKGFQQLFGQSFTAEDAKKLGDVDAALKAVTERIAALGRNSQKDAVISQLGLTGLKPLILDGVDAMSSLREEAQRVGVVMDADLVAKGAEANDKFETLSKILDVQVKSAFVNLAPVIGNLVGLMGDLAKGASNIASAFRNLKLNDARTQLVYLQGEQSRAPLDPNSAQRNLINERALKIQRLQLQIQQLTATDAPPPKVKAPREGGTELFDTSTKTKAAKEARERFNTNPRMELDELNARREMLELDNKIARLRAQGFDDTAQAWEDERDKRRLVSMFEEHGLTTSQAMVKAQEQITALVVARGAATKDATLAEQLATSQTKTKAGIDSLNDNLLAKTEFDADSLERMRDDFRYTFTDGIRAAIDGDVGGFFEDLAGRFTDRLIGNLADQLFDSMLSGGKGGGGGGFLGSLAAGAGKLFGFAGGTNFAPGGMAIVGEQGPELVNLPRGGQVVPNDVLRSLSNMKAPRAGPASIVTPITIHLNAQGAGPREIDQLRGMVSKMQADLPQTIHRTVNDGIGRRSINAVPSTPY